jgi:hypothetical protein
MLFMLHHKHYLLKSVINVYNAMCYQHLGELTQSMVR